MFFRFLFVALTSTTLLAHTNAAQADALREALDTYWLRHPTAQALTARTDAAEAGHAAAHGLLAGAPTLALSRLDERAGAGSETELEIALPLAGNRAERQQQAAAVRSAVQAEIASLRLQLAAELLRLNSERLLRDEQLQLSQQRLQLAQALERDVEQKITAGELAHADRLLAKTETLAADAARLAAEQAAEDALAQWQLRVGNQPALPESLVAPAAAALDTHPQWLHAQALAQAAAARARFERRRSGDAELSLLLKREDDPDFATPIDSAGLRFSLPLFAGAQRSQGVAEAEAERLEVEAESQQLRLSLAREQHQARSHWQRISQQVTLAAEQRHLSEQSLQLAHAAFNAGETALAELLRVRQRLFDSNEQLSQLKQQQRDALARLIEAEGVLP